MKKKTKQKAPKQYFWEYLCEDENRLVPTHYESLVLNLARARYAYGYEFTMEDCLEAAIEAVAVTEKWLKQRRKK